MDRLEELKKIFENVEADKKALIYPLIEEVVSMEKRLSQLKKYPFILYNKRTGETKSTSASKQFKELEQQYINCLKVLLSVLRNGTEEEEDAFDLWLKQNQNE